LPASDAAFSSVLDRAVATHTQRRERINQLVKNDISTNLKRAKEIEERLKTLDAPEATTLRHELATLATAYKTLVAEVADLRKQQKATILELQVADGSIMPVPVAQMVGVTRPNELGWFGRLGLCLNRMWHFLADNPRESNTEGGIFPAIFGTFAMTLLMSLAVTPLGVVAAIYLREYARQGPVVRAVRIAVNNLAGVPSIVFGVFGMGFFVLIVGGSIDQAFFSAQLPNPTFGTGGILWASLTLALMTVPVVIVATEESVAAVPRGMKEGSLACGASKWQTIQRIVLPAAVPGILTGLILAMARGAGEVAPLMLVGVVKNATSFPITGEWPFVHLDQKFMHLGFHIYDLGFQSPDSDAAKPMVFATTLFLIVLVLVLNLGAIILRDRLRKRFATGAF
jgi:phosphate transport system permease protein